MRYFFLIGLILLTKSLFSQYCYWQQSADYKMYIDFDVQTHQFKGDQTITYTNNSPDTLRNLYYHLYFNAFQPNSEMDLRSRNIQDPDGRVASRIFKLKPNEVGYIKVNTLKMDGSNLKFKTVGTILEVSLDKPILPKQKVKLEMKFDAQVPLQIRRSGRDSKEGIEYSMAQWYPKLCGYDYMGWHPNPYVGREFYGCWGNFDVTIDIDSRYILGGTGILVNANEIGYGYSNKVIDKRPAKHKWKFVAKKVHDFMWAADKDYKHTTKMTKDGVFLHFLYQENEKTKENWEKLPDIMDKALTFMNKRYGKYPYESYSFIQGGDGGMEYPMATLITGERKINSLVGVCVHEWMHSWYQNTLATNEALYPWMDEGFTSFGTSETMDYLIKTGVIQGNHDENPLDETINGYIEFVKSGIEEAISGHSDHYVTNSAYGVGSYTKGQLCLSQLEYIMGKETFARALLRYYNEWKFKHPHPNDFFRVMEKESGMVLDWFNHYWINTTHHTDYKIDTVINQKVILRRLGEKPMPLEILVTLKNGNTEKYYIPLTLMRNIKRGKEMKEFEIKESWPWAQPTYELDLKSKMDKIEKIEIVPDNWIIDIDMSNNTWKGN